jgi:hypothetical protein
MYASFTWKQNLSVILQEELRLKVFGNNIWSLNVLIGNKESSVRTILSKTEGFGNKIWGLNILTGNKESRVRTLLSMYSSPSNARVITSKRMR